MNRIQNNQAFSDSKALEEDEKKRKRKERNRESARECRRRKKEKKLTLRQTLAHLEGENLQLRLKLQIGHETTLQEDKSAYITTKLDAMIKDNSSETDILKAIQELQERFSDYGRDRRSAIDFHVNQLRRCLQPTQTTRAILFLMKIANSFQAKDGESFVKTEGDSLNNLWFSLLEAIKPNKEQMKLMISYSTQTDKETDKFRAIDKASETCDKMLDSISDIILNKNETLDNEMNNLQTILSGRQIAKFILWIDQNPACMHMLEALWPHIAFSTDDTNNSNGNNNNNNNSDNSINNNSSDNESGSTYNYYNTNEYHTKYKHDYSFSRSGDNHDNNNNTNNNNRKLMINNENSQIDSFSTGFGSSNGSNKKPKIEYSNDDEDDDDDDGSSSDDE